MSIVFRTIALLLVPISMAGQTAAPAPQAAAPAKPATPPVAKRAPAAPSTSLDGNAPSSPVITIAGVCDKPAVTPAKCSTVVTRAEFERLAKIVQPEMAAAGRQRLATLYAQLVVFAYAAQQRGLSKTPEAQEAVHFAKVQALSQVLGRKLQADLPKVTLDDMQKYYNEHSKQFEEGTLLRLYVPRAAQAGGKTISESDSQAEIKKLRDRAVKGESFESLQKQALSDLGVQGNTPATELKKVRRSGLSPASAAVFDQQIGAVSEPIAEPNGLYIFQMAAKRVLTLQEAASEIMSSIQNQRLQQALEQISSTSKTTFNTGYFAEGDKTSPTSATPSAGAAPSVKPAATPK